MSRILMLFVCILGILLGLIGCPSPEPDPDPTPDETPTTWGDIDTLASYSTAYSFGAYLARNFGGVQLFRNIVQNSNTDNSVIASVLSAGGYNETFETVITKWAAANLVSDNTDAPVGCQYNTNNYINSSLGGITYNLGSINLYNYYFSSGNLEGPYFYTSAPISIYGEHLNTSNLCYRVGSDLTGTVSRAVTYGDGVTITIVVKDD